jgi:hypothetical protein
MIKEVEEYGQSNIFITNESKRKIIDTFNYNLGKYQVVFGIKEDMKMNPLHDFIPNTIDFRSSFTDNTVVFISNDRWASIKHIYYPELSSNKDIIYSLLVTKENVDKTFNARISFTSFRKVWFNYYDSKFHYINPYCEQSHITSKNAFDEFIDYLINPKEYKHNVSQEVDMYLSQLFDKEVSCGRVDYNMKISAGRADIFSKEIAFSILLKDSYRDKMLCLLRVFSEPTPVETMLFTVLDEGLPKIHITKKNNIHVGMQLIQLMALYDKLKCEVVQC